jgi:folate-binding protein YgfZ
VSRTVEEYRIIVSGAGRADRRAFGRVRVSGGDAVGFLHALVTNDVAALAPGRGVYAACLTPQGRILDDLRLYYRGAHLLASVEPGRADPFVARLDASLFAEDVTLADVTAGTTEIRVLGARAAAIVAAALGVESAALDALPPLAQLDAPWDAPDAPPGATFVARADDLGVPAFDVIAPADAHAELVARLEAAGAPPVGDALLDALRIAAGRPRFGVDMTGETIPLEAGVQDRMISMSKGCYPGQEVIVRVLHRGGGRVARRLVRLALTPDATSPPGAGAVIAVADAEVGRVTSAAWSPADDRVVALGYVRREVAESPVPVTVDGTPAVIAGLAG